MSCAVTRRCQWVAFRQGNFEFVTAKVFLSLLSFSYFPMCYLISLCYCMFVCVCVYVCMYVCMYFCVCVYRFVSVYVTYVYICVCMYVSVLYLYEYLTIQCRSHVLRKQSLWRHMCKVPQCTVSLFHHAAVLIAVIPSHTAIVLLTLLKQDVWKWLGEIQFDGVQCINSTVHSVVNGVVVGS
jgi:hypothetical protein